MNEPKKLPQQSLTYATEPDLRSRAWIEISREALEHNVAYLRSLLPHGCTLMPVVKANAYGHGAGLIAGELSALGIRSFCVACVSEGVELRRQKIEGEILVLGYTHPDQFPLLDQYALTQTVADQAHALALSAYACSASRRLLFSCSCASDGVPGQPASSSGSVDCEYRRASQAAIPQQPASSPGSVDCEYRHASQAAILRQPASSPGSVDCEYRHASQAAIPQQPVSSPGSVDCGHQRASQAAILRQPASSSGSVDCEYRRASQVTAPGDPPPLPVQVAVDTGMRRLGVPAEQEGCIREIFALPGLQITGLYSHLAASGGVDDASQNFTQNQIDAFRLLTERLGLRRLQEGGHTREAVHAPVRLHLQASYGILHYPMPDMDCARPGIALYGLLSNASDTCVYGEQLRPVLSLRARVASVRR
ncbi:MAG: hypothetical protein HFH80_13705, partial [Lachnospiraceae bacterium]|nr:hypothetical protein [Lachnospiraceae bacterium]